MSDSTLYCMVLYGIVLNSIVLNKHCIIHGVGPTFRFYLIIAKVVLCKCTKVRCQCCLQEWGLFLLVFISVPFYIFCTE
jgi:hypothetical protein